MNDTTISRCSTTSLHPVDAAFGPTADGCRFDFTFAFEQYFFSIVPSVLLLLVAPIRINVLRKRKVQVGGENLRSIKLATIAIFALLQLTTLILWTATHLHGLRTPAAIASSLSFLSSLSLFLLSYHEHSKSLRPSFLLNTYLFLTFLFDIAVLRTLWTAFSPPNSSSSSLAVRNLFTASFAFKAVILFLEGKEKRRYLKQEEGGVGRGPGPEETSGLYSQSLVWWLNFLIRDGYRRVLKPLDLYPVDESMTSAVLHGRFEREWAKASLNGGTPSLVRVIVKLLKWPLLVPVLPRLALLGFTFCQPLLVSRLLDFLQDHKDSKDIGYGLVGAYTVVYFGMSVSNSLFMHQNYRSLTMIRGTLVTAIYAKTTEISITAVDDNAAVTLMSTNVETLVLGLRGLHDIWANMVQMVLATYLLETKLGWACIGPTVAVFSTAASVGVLAPVFTRRQLAWIAQVKKRVGITSTVLGHMKGIKMLGLSDRMANLVQELRANELKYAAREWAIDAIVASLAFSPQTLAPVATFAFYVIVAKKEGQVLDVSTLFTSLALLVLLTQPLFQFFEDIIAFNSTFGNVKKIEAFLQSQTRSDHRLFSTDNTVPKSSDEESIDDSRIGAADRDDIELVRTRPRSQLPHGSSTEVVRIEDGSFGWKADADSILRDINLTIYRSQLTLLVGPVASGKSTLLKAMLGETHNSKGFIHMAEPEIAYCDQTPWLTNVSVKDNVIGFADFDQVLYSSVIYACDLEQDISTFPASHDTIIGSKGISLSTGQKQRIAIARAIYSRKRLVIFDDVFSGLDVNTQKNVFTRLLGPEGVLRKWKTTVLVATHAVNLLPLSDRIIALSSSGTIVEQGTFSELDSTEGYVHKFRLEHAHDQYFAEESSRISSGELNTPLQALAEVLPEIEDKSRQLGDWEVYKYYGQTHGVVAIAIFLFLAATGGFLNAFPTVWLEWYVEANVKEPGKHTGYYLGIYTALQCIMLIDIVCFISYACNRFFFGLIGTDSSRWTLQVMARRAGLRFHMTMVKTVMAAPMSFFSKTDIGSITTRFSQDIGLLDGSLPLSTMMVALGFLSSFGQIGLIASGAYYVSICFPFLFAVYFLVQRYYLRTSRQMRFLDLEEKAPVYTQFLESLAGLATLRAFGWQKPSVLHNHTLVDKSQKPYYLMFMIQTWLTLVLDLITTALAMLVVGVSVKMRDTVSVGFTGVSLVQIVGFTSNLRLSITFWTQMETSIGAVARVKKFATETENENDPRENMEPPPEWPGKGAIDIENLTVSYGTDAKARKALDNVSLSISPNTKVAVVGRTGSGKSTLLSTLFRLISISSGQIRIDGIDISTVPRHYVRTRLNAISEDAFFIPSSSIRLNLDPHCQANDTELEAVLRRTNLWDVVDRAGGLSAEWNDDMLSHGQRQIFCLARALLRPGKIVVLDEVSSAVDRETDALMQRIIREDFAQKTVIVVAHRVQTIRDFDMVVVLADGKVVEAGSPETLMRQEGLFREMVERGL